MQRRRFLKVSKEQQRSMQDHFQGIFDALENWYDTGEMDGADRLSISVFDHWLSQNEAKSMIDNVSDLTQSEHNRKLQKFVYMLTSEFESYLVKFKGRRHNKITFRKFTSDVAREKMLILQEYYVSGRWRFVLAIPELNALYFESDDFTHHFYSYGKMELGKIKPLLDACDVHPL